MANSEGGSSSAAAQALEGEFHVFLSFRGSNYYHGFTDFLYHGLVDAGARVFKEEDNLQEGEVIGENILKAINNSIIYILIFSRSYVFSKWCLRELSHIVDNVSKSDGEKSIIPIFLDGESDDAKISTSQYTDALLEHASKFPDEVKVWRKALAEVDEIKGWNVKKDQGQAAIIKLVIEKVLAKLETKQNSATEHLVGLEDRIKHLTELLNVNHHDVRFIVIYGMDGIGKTTVAKTLFNRLSSNFGKCCSFIENIRECSSTKEGIVQLQKKLMYDIVGSGSVEQLIDIEQAMRTIGDSLSAKKVLMVLDDVDKKEHINYLIGGYSLYSGSRIIITNRNRIALNVKGHRHRILWYEMPKMDDALALGLFCQHAFGRDFPINEYHGLSSKIVSNLGGLPLAIQVTGSLLNGKDEAFWKEILLRLRDVPAEEILETLRISYDSLDKYQQQIFLDIACFLFNENKTDAIYMWTDCHFYPIRGIKVLMDRCLIKIMDNDKIWMHDQLINLGRRIVRQENPFNPGKRSRLWIPKEALQIIGTKKRKDEVQAIKIFSSGDSINITNDDFERLQNLRFLELNWGTYAGDFARFRSNLRWFSWHSPQDFRADNMCFDHLVVCKLDAINFKDDSKAWDLIKGAENLKALSLTRCTGITTIPDLAKCSCLERLTLLDCFNLKRIESFIGDLRSLIELKIEECRGLTDLPEEVGALVKLKHFSMSGCSGLRELPGTLGNLTSLTELDLSDTTIRELPNSIGMLSSLRILRLPIGELIDRKRHVWQLPSGIGTLVTLEELNLCGRNEIIGEIPVEIGELSSLKILNLEYTSIHGIPRTIDMLHHLHTLNLRSCHEIRMLPKLPPSLTCLLLESKSLIVVPNLSNQTNLVELQLSDGSRDNKKSNLITGSTLRWIGRLYRLKKLELELLNVPAPPELASLSHLEELVLRHLDLEPLVQLPSSNWSLRSLSTLKLYRCEVEDIPLVGLPLLEILTVEGCKRLQRLSIPLELRKLLEMLVLECPELVEIQVLGLLKSLEYLRVFHCESLISISGLSHLKNLESLALEECSVLTEVEGLDELESMKHLQVQECTSLRSLIDVSCTKIADDCLVTIKRCGDSIKDSEWEMPLQRYREEILLITSNKRETEGGKTATARWEKFMFWRTSTESGNNEKGKGKGKEKTEGRQTAAGKTGGGQTAAGTSEESCTKEKEKEKEKEKVEVKEETGGGETTEARKTSEGLFKYRMKTVVSKLGLHREKDRIKAMKKASGFAGDLKITQSSIHSSAFFSPSVQPRGEKCRPVSLPTPRSEGDILSSPHLKAFTFSELKKATRNFRPDSLIGEGGFGRVFKGWIDVQTLGPAKPGCGMAVAIKKFEPEGFPGPKEWLAEVNYLGQLHHPNLVKLIGYCLDGDNRLLVHEHMPRGSLENHLFRRAAQPLTWAIRIKVATGAARGLSFLHESEQQVIYRNFKASNILLDSEYDAKLSDFGLAKAGPIGDRTHVSTQVMGTYGYAAPEYIATGHLTARCDVYSFGVVLLELLSGRRALDKTKVGMEQNLVDWAKPYLRDKRKLYHIMDVKLEGQYPHKGAFMAAFLALECIGDAKRRPSMTEVLARLEKIPVPKS